MKMFMAQSIHFMPSTMFEILDTFVFLERSSEPSFDRYNLWVFIEHEESTKILKFSLENCVTSYNYF